MIVDGAESVAGRHVTCALPRPAVPVLRERVDRASWSRRRCGIGSWGIPRPSLGDYVAARAQGRGARRWRVLVLAVFSAYPTRVVDMVGSLAAVISRHLH
jgi:hypothetical protein